ncbi:Hypothetical predicted protein [Cloeon dipterum]|uniref:F-box domain-containing protein n=1 Tax=Cloeon dipterum TaxID=197152 RepID=A0A8S1DIF4_9INSE|nr:Hypothetical predicted protein [Cloeon dipterum]
MGKDEEEARFVELTKVRLEDLRRRQSLEEVLVRYVADNIHLFFEHNQLVKLPIQVREKILQRVLQFGCSGDNGNPEMLQKFLNALPQLLSPRTRKVDLEGFFSCGPDNSAMMQVFSWIASLAPNVEELFILCKVGAKALRMHSLLQPLSQMKKLRKMMLRVIEFRFADLSKLCGTLPNLQVVSVGALCHVEHDLRGRSEHKRNLQNLRVLEDNQWCQHHRALLATVAPHLDYIMSWIHDYLPLSSDEKKTPPLLKRRILTLEARGILEEGHKLALKYPNITHLVIEAGYLEVQSFESVLHFKKIKFLTFDGVLSWAIVERILAAFGHQLHSLAICCDLPSKALNLEQISQLCPKLEVLHLGNVSVPDTTMEVFPELTDLFWINESVVLSPSSVLCAPKLKKVLMMGVFCVSDLEKCTKMIEKGDALRELQSLSVDLGHTIIPDFNQKHFNAAARMVKTASALLPKLAKCCFHLRMQYTCFEFDGRVRVPIEEKFDLDTCCRLLNEYNKHNGVYP